MATSTSPAETNHVPTAPHEPDLPPEEQFWQRYSPHHEFPMSSVGTVLVYLLAGVAIWAVIQLSGIFNPRVQQEVAAVSVDEGTTGDGRLPGLPGNPGAAGTEGPKEGVDDGQATPEETKSVDLPPLRDIPPVAVDQTQIAPDIIADDALLTNASKSLQDLARMKKADQEAITAGLRGRKKGTPGSGSGGNNGENGTGGDVRVKRMARWSLVFTTHNGEDYANQLAAMGAIIGIPTNEPDKFVIIRDLKRPNPQVEDVTKINLMRWADNRPDSVAGLAQALRLPSTPQVVWAFFPKELEEAMRTAEKNYRHLEENQIAETRFIVTLRGSRYVPVVTDQRPLNR